MRTASGSSPAVTREPGSRFASSFGQEVPTSNRVLDAAPVPIIVADPDGIVVIWNRAAEQQFGWSTEEVVGRRNPSVPADRWSELLALRESILQGERRVFETQRLRRDGSVLDVLVTAAGARDETGTVTRIIAIVQDLTEFRAVQSRAHAAEERSRALLDTGIAVLFIGDDCRVLDANRGARLLLGASQDEAVALDLHALLNFSDSGCEAALREAATTGRFTAELWCTRLDGSRFWGDVELAPIYAENGVVRELVLVLRDASRRRSEQERERRRLRQSVAVSACAQRATHELTAEAVAAAAVEHVAASIEGAYVELAGPTDGGALVTTHTFGSRKIRGPAEIDAAPGTIYAEARGQREVVLRALTEHDLDHAPHLRELGMRWGAALAMRRDQATCVLAAFSKTEIGEEDLYPLRSIASICEAVTARRIAERKLAAHDHTLTMILDQMPAILSTFDRELRFTSVQGAGLRALEGLDTDIIGQSIDSVTRPDGPARPAFQAAVEGKSSSFRAVWNGRYYENRVEPLRDTNGEIVGGMNLGMDMTERVRNEEALGASREELRRLSARLTQLQEEERRRIAHELHDELGQRLTALRMETSLLPHKLGRRGTRAASEAIASMIELIDETIVTVRRVSTELRPPILDDFGLRAALEIELGSLQKRSGIDFAIHVAPDDLRVGRDHATTLYRIVQESLTNVARHAGATFVRVSLEQHDDALVLEIADDGRGITRDELASGSSLGLLGIRERAHAHGGTAEIRAREEGGTVVSVRLPAGGAP